MMGQAHFILGDCYQRNSEEERALAWYLKAVEPYPSLAEAHNNKRTLGSVQASQYLTTQEEEDDKWH